MLQKYHDKFYIVIKSDMAVHNKETEFLDNKFPDFTERDINWLQQFLIIKFGISFGDVDGFYAKKVSISDFISQKNDELVKEIKFNHSERVVKRSCIDWIDENNNRQVLWLINCGLIFGMQPILIYPSWASKKYYDLFILSFDLLNISLKIKEDHLSLKKNEWSTILADKKHSNWLKKGEKGQIEWAWDYLIVHAKNAIAFFTTNPDEYHDAILATFDKMLYLGEHIDTRKVFIDRMKKAWSQKKFRDSGKAKKPYHLPLTEPTKKKLDELAKLNDMKEAAFLEELIKETYAKDILDEKGKIRYKPNNPI